MKVSINAPDGRILARIINLASRVGCTVQSCALAQEAQGAKIEASFSGSDHQLKLFGGQLTRMLGDEQATSTIQSG